jgi:hypothetical protein
MTVDTLRREEPITVRVLFTKPTPARQVSPGDTITIDSTDEVQLACRPTGSGRSRRKIFRLDPSQDIGVRLPDSAWATLVEQCTIDGIVMTLEPV